MLYADATLNLGAEHEARIVIEHVAKRPFALLLTHLDEDVTPADHQIMSQMVARRKNGEPLQHIVGEWQFRSIDLVVDRRALIPRPETEVVAGCAINALRAYDASQKLRVVDLGTGTGAIALAIATEVPNAFVIGVDISEEALSLATQNRDRMSHDIQSRVELRKGDFYGALQSDEFGTIDVIVSNPPYISTAEWEALDPVVRDFDPYGALVSGTTGLESIEMILHGAAGVLTRPGTLVMEIAPHQHEQVVADALRYGAQRASTVADFVQRERALVATW